MTGEESDLGSSKWRTVVTLATRTREHQLAHRRGQDSCLRKCSTRSEPMKRTKVVKKPVRQGVYTLKYDGASKGNPGRAGAGALLLHPDGNLVCSLAEGVGRTTNNVAEYRGLILGLREALERGIYRIKARGDSTLVCQQVNGKWKVNSPHLQLLCEEVKLLAGRFETFSIAYVPREQNAEADLLANKGVTLPEKAFISTSNQNEILTKRAASTSRGSGADQIAASDLDSKSSPLSNSVERNVDQAVYTMEFDGVATGRPPRAGAGAVLRHPEGEVVLELVEGLGQATSNAAEYHALIIGLKAAQSRGISHLQVKGDSSLVCQQLLGKRNVSYHHVKLYDEAKALIEQFAGFSIQQIDSSLNQEANALAKKATAVPGSKARRTGLLTKQKEISGASSTKLCSGLHGSVAATNLFKSVTTVPAMSTAQLQAACVSCRRSMSSQRLFSTGLSARVLRSQATAVCGVEAAVWLTKLGRAQRPWTAAAKFVTQIVVVAITA